MLTFLTRRLIASILVLLVASYIVYVLAATAGREHGYHDEQGNRDPHARHDAASPPSWEGPRRRRSTMDLANLLRAASARCWCVST